MVHVVIGMDPHKRSATIEVLDERETVLATGRFGTDREGYQQLLAAGRRWPGRRLPRSGIRFRDGGNTGHPMSGCSPWQPRLSLLALGALDAWRRP